MFQNLSADQISSTSDHQQDFQDGSRGVRSTSSGFVSNDVTLFQKPKSICKPNIVDISQLTDEIYLLPVWENKRPPYWNFSPGCDFDHIAVIGMSFCIRVPNFIQIAPLGDMTSYRFLKMAAVAQYYFRFPNCWCHFFRKSNSIIKANVVDIAQFTADITSSVLEKETSTILEFYFRYRFDYITEIGMLFCINLPNVIYIVPPIAEI